MDTVTVNGLDLGYRRAGQGPPVMFVHGGAVDSRSWTPQLEALSDEFTVIAWDEPGAGSSADIPEGFGLSDYADYLAGFLRALQLSPLPVVGLSWGTTVILELYRRHPKIVQTMVLADGYAGWRGSLGAEEADRRWENLQAVPVEPSDAQPLPAPGLFAGDPPERFLPLLEKMAAAVRPTNILTPLMAIAQADLTEVLPTIQVPTQLIWGELDVRSPLSVAREFERLIPGAKLEIIPDCGHVSNLEAPAAFNTIIRRFLQTYE